MAKVYTIQLNDYPYGKKAYTSFDACQKAVLTAFGKAPENPDYLIKIKDMTFVRIYEFELED